MRTRAAHLARPARWTAVARTAVARTAVARTAVARTAVALGLGCLAAAAATGSSGSPGQAPGRAAHPQSLREILRAAGSGPEANPHEDMAAQQAFQSGHFGTDPLADPIGMSAALHRSITESAAVPASTQYGRGWQLRGPNRYFANDHYRSGNLTNLGMQNLSGRVTTIATTNVNSDLLWIGTAGGGAWKSLDAGRTWTPEFDRQHTLAIGSVAIDPTNQKRVYVGTGEPNTNADAYYGDGMYVTRDGGRHWAHAPLPGVLTVFHVEAVGPSSGYPHGRVFAATNNGLWLSTDRGRHYHNVALPTDAKHTGVYTATPFGNFVTDVRVRPHHPNEVVAVVGWRRGQGKEPNGKIDSVGNGFYRSTKSGARGTFRYVAQNEPGGLGVPGNNADPTPSNDPIGRTSIAYSADGKYLWAVVQDAGNFRHETLLGDTVTLPAQNTILNGVYLSTTADPSSWTPKGNVDTFSSAQGSGLTAQASGYWPGVQAWYDQYVAVDPADDSRVLVGLEEVYQTIANATGPGLAAWRTVGRYWNGCALLSSLDCSTVPGPVYNGTATHADQHAAAFVRLQNGTSKLYAGSDGGVFSQVAHATDEGYTGYDNSHWKYLNPGLATTEPYYAVEASDGTVYAGLQDNGEVKIEAGGTDGYEVYGGDGFDTAVDPGNSSVVYEEYTYGDVNVSTDGGLGWTDIAPCDATSSQSQFSTPFTLDPRNANHVVEVGRFVDESTAGPKTNGGSVEEGQCLDPGDWQSSYDLGSSRVAGKPGVTGAGANNVATAVAVYGSRMYVPFCGLCDPISQGAGVRSYFHSGIATNVKPGCTPVTGSSSCWHKAAAIGLPNRYVQGVAIDPRNPRTVYVALSDYLRRWWKNPARGGNVYVSHDAGQHFTNISGNLPHGPANALVLRNGSVFVGTDMGVFVARQGSTHWARVGGGLPNASVLDLRLNPNGSHLVAATHGRGVWIYSFGSKAAAPYRQVAGPALGPAATGSPSGWRPDYRLALPGALLLLLGLAGHAMAAACRRRLRPA